MFHNTIDGELPQSVPTLTEYIKEKAILQVNSMAIGDVYIHTDLQEGAISMYIKFNQWEQGQSMRL